MNLYSLAGWDWIWEGINNLLLVLTDWTYILITWFYRVFNFVAKVNLFSKDIFSELTSRIYIIIGIGMLFAFAYNIVVMIINPDNKKITGGTSKVVKETIISLTLVVLLPTIFNYMQIFQNNVLDSDIIGNIIFSKSAATMDPSNCDPSNFDCTCDFRSLDLKSYAPPRRGFLHTVLLYSFTAGSQVFFDIYDSIKAANGGEVMLQVLEKSCENHRDNLIGSERGANSVAATLLSAFYKPVPFTYEDCVDYLTGKGSSNISSNEDKKVCSNYFIDYNIARYTGSVHHFAADGYLRQIVSDSDKDLMEFNGLLAIIAGIVAGWMFLCYAMEIGVRVAKLGVLQLISPVTVMMRVIPGKKESVYDKWLKQLIETYLDVFIRLVIIYFCLFAISLVPNVMKTLWNTLFTGGNVFVVSLSSVIVILGILKFGGDFPKLIKEYFGDTGHFSLRSPLQQFNDNKPAKNVVGYAGGALLGGLSAAKQKKNVFTGMLRGGKNGARNVGGADLTKKGSFLGAMKDAKYQTDYEQNHGKFKAIRSDIQAAGGFGNYVKEGFNNFGNFLGDPNKQSERYGAANKLAVDSASFNDVVINGVIKDENKTKDLWADYKDLGLGNKWFTRDNTRGVWVNKDDDGNEQTYSKSAMKSEIDKYFATTKADAIAERLHAATKEGSTDKAILDTLKAWSTDFNKTFREEFPKLGENVAEGFFNTVNSSGALEVEVKSMEELMKRMDELQKQGLEGNKEAFKAWSEAKVLMDKGFDDIKKGQYKDMHQAKDK